MAGIYDMADEPYVYDQCCKNCKWWNPDPVTGNMVCRNYRSEKAGRYMKKGKSWCWRWQKKGGAGR